MKKINNKKHFCFVLLGMISISMLFLGSRVFAMNIDAVRFGAYPDKVRMVLDLSDISDFRVFTLSDPYRMVIDLPNTSWQAGTVNRNEQTFVSDIRHGKLNQDISRIVFDLKQPVMIKAAFMLPQNGEKPNRLVVDYQKTDQTTFQSQKGNIFGTLKTDHEQTETAQSTIPDFSVRPTESSSVETNTIAGIPLPPPNAMRPKRIHTAAPSVFKKHLIIIDPGHGGVDPGATNGRIYEKHIVLALAKALKSELLKTGRYEVKMTRETDVFIRLKDRVKFARKHEGDLFVSIHADSIKKPQVHGSSIYTLSKKASDAQTAKLAEKENQADLMAGVHFEVEDEQVAFILGDFLINDTMNQSKFFANTVVSSFRVNGLHTLDTPHRYAGFAVLKAPDIPSILIEAGFVSNAAEAKLLSTESHRKKLAKAIRSGIDTYFDYVHKNERN